MSKPMRRKIAYTTGDVARICNCAPRTVSKWFDAGILKGYRLPRSQDRRVPHDNLLEFMQNHGIPVPKLFEGRARHSLQIS
jgi:two-component system response regulator RpaA